MSFNDIFIQYAKVKKGGTVKFSYNSSSPEYKGWLTYRRKIYELKDKVITLSNEIKILKCHLR